MRFDASLKRLQKAVSDLEKTSKKLAKSKKSSNNNQIDMFAAPVAQHSPSNDIDIDQLKQQLDDAIESVENVLKEPA
jgi:Sec-independent protein translocase protein TatA